MKDIIIKKADVFAHRIYAVSKQFPKEEMYGLTSQLRRAAISVVLNLIEGYARNRNAEHIRFMEIAYGSLKEVKYLLYFSFKEQYIEEKDYQQLIDLSEEIGKLIWVKKGTLKRKI